MTPDQLRQALHDLNGDRDVTVVFDRADTCAIGRAMLVPQEEDNLIKLTDGACEYIIDADRVAWIRISKGSALET